MKRVIIVKSGVIIGTVLLLLFTYLTIEAVEGAGELYTSIVDSIRYDRAVAFILNEEYIKGSELLDKIRTPDYKDRYDFEELCDFANSVKNEKEFSTYILDMKDFGFCSPEQKVAVYKLKDKLKKEYEPIRERIEEEKAAEKAREAEEEKKAEARLRSSLKGKVPCVGMSEKNISSTSLGSYSSKSTGQYYSVGKNYSYNTYNFSDGKRIIFSARCENGVVTEVSDYRGNANIIVPKYDDSDRYDASSYRNAEDFYDDNYYAFHDYYQAEKYWREHRAG